MLIQVIHILKLLANFILSNIVGGKRKKNLLVTKKLKMSYTDWNLPVMEYEIFMIRMVGIP